MLRPSAVWTFDTGTNLFVNSTSGVHLNTNISFLSATGQYFYIGGDRRSIGLYCDLATNGSYTGLSYQYWNSAGSWSNLSLIDTYAFASSKYQRWVLPDKDWIKVGFTSTSPHTATPPDNIERYWMRTSATAVTTQAVISKLRLIPYTEYTDSKKVAEFLELKNVFDSSTKPTDLTVEDFIRRAEDRIDYRTRKSWRFNVVTEETEPILVDFNRYGMYLRHKNFLKVYSVSLWNGAAWASLVEGRARDYFVNYNLGMIVMARMFLLPAVFGMAGRYTQYDYGEYKYAVKVDYAYGRDSETDSEFFVIEDICTKMVAMDLLRHHDYSVLFPSGVDKVTMSEKLRDLKEEVELRMEELTGISIY